jgi:TctA family transporter
MLDRPIALAFLTVAVAMLLWPALRAATARRTSGSSANA